jgi:predicted ATP-grasp superfamily ATP-dependent carboligase
MWPERSRTGTRPGALVIGANLRALAIARSLGRRGIPTWLLHSAREDQVARASRYVGRTLPAPTGNAEQQLEGLLTIASDHRLQGWALFPTDDESAAMLAQLRPSLSATFTSTTPDWDVFRHAYHKRLTHALAERAGLEHPWTAYPRTPEDLASLDCQFPVILKPDVKPEENRFTADKAWRFDDRSSLIAAWRKATSLVGVDSVMVQELIPGAGGTQYSFGALCQEGVPLAWLAARRTRQYPRDFGRSSSLVETIDAPAIEERARAVIEALRWTGLVEIEFMHDIRDDSYKLLDINGRAWTWHGIGARAGVDFPYLAWRLAQGLPVTPVRGKSGIRWIRLATDLPSALGAIRLRELSVREWCESVRSPRVGALLAVDDPLPSIADPLLTAGRLVGRTFRLSRPHLTGSSAEGVESAPGYLATASSSQVATEGGRGENAPLARKHGGPGAVVDLDLRAFGN